MFFKARRYLTAALVLSLLIRMHIATNVYAARRTKIAFTCWRDGNHEICVMDGDGGGFTRRVSRDPPNNSNPAWSPDGNTIAYVAWGLVNSTINLMTPEGKHLEQLTEDGFYSADPGWFDPVGRPVSPATNFVTIWGKIKAPSAARR